jgi:hypothetical protein
MKHEETLKCGIRSYWHIFLEIYELTVEVLENLVDKKKKNKENFTETADCFWNYAS